MVAGIVTQLDEHEQPGRKKTEKKEYGKEKKKE
jgi:hypothetical protein